MANTTTLLTDTQLRKAKPREKEYNLSDPGGLQLRIRPSGSKVWLFNYSKPIIRNRTNMKLGVYPDLSLVDARKTRDRYRELLAKEIDPQEHKVELDQKKSEAHKNTLKYIADKWFQIKKPDLSPEYAKSFYASLENHVFPDLGSFPIHKISAPITIDVLQPLNVAGHLKQVRLICSRLNMIMDYAVNVGIVTANPLSGIHKAFRAPKVKNYPTLEPKELPKLTQAIDSTNMSIVIRCLLKWLLHTMVRPSEAAGARWQEIDIENMLWKIPAERMKKRKPHLVPLTPQALAILEILKPISGHREHLFPNFRDPRRPVHRTTPSLVFSKMGFKDKLVPHSMRALSSTTLNEQAFDSDLIEVALAHQDKNTVRAAYNRAEYLERRRVMMQWWSNHIEEATTGMPDKGKKHLKIVNG